MAFVIGDAQASFATFQEILAAHNLLDASGQLAPDSRLVAVGDYFDFGRPAERLEAAKDGLAIISWLAAQPADQVGIIAGNHDLGRVGELAGFDDATFSRAHQEALAIYQAPHGADRDERERDLLARYPSLPTAELAARDFSCFAEAQRDAVWSLLSKNRMRAAIALDSKTLVCHAGVTTPDLEATGLDPSQHSDAHVIASHLNAALAEAVAQSTATTPLAVDGLHQPGSANNGEGLGMFYHRPAQPGLPVNAGYSFDGVLRRRFDPRQLPPGITQIIGHISDNKCRSLLGDWAIGEPAQVGEHRTLIADREDVAYQAGVYGAPTAQHGRIIFVDSGMSRIPASSYQLFDAAEIGITNPRW